MLKRSLLVLTMVLVCGSKLHAQTCSSYTGRHLGDAVVRSATAVAAGSFRVGRAPAIEGLPAFCRVIATSSPGKTSLILFEIWLPQEGWNGKLLGTGNGAFGGNISTIALVAGLKHGYATVNTDMGTFPAGNVPNAGYDAGIGFPDMVEDWGFRSTHEMTVFAKAMVRSFYGKAADKSYFQGCSTGGHQGLSEVQRYPDDYDGVIAGAPGHNRTHLHLSFSDLFQKAQKTTDGYVPQQLSKLVHDAAVNSCRAQSHGAPSDDYLSDPSQCLFAPSTLLCKAGESTPQCLSAAQVETVEAALSGTRNPRTGELVYPQWPPTSHIFGFFGAKDADASVGPADGVLRWAMGANWDNRTLNLDTDTAKIDRAIGPTVNSLSIDISRFIAHGGKLILFHGWEDGTVSPLDTILYYTEITSDAKDRQAAKDDFTRLFMVPSMGHCGGGDGATVFNQQSLSVATDAEHDVLTALDAWVTTGHAPQTLLASKLSEAGAVIAERPICAYPQIAQYDGKGDPSKAASFACKPGTPAKVEKPGAQYLR